MSKLLKAIVLSTAALLATGSVAVAEEGDYAKTIKLKAASGLSNVTMGILEVPKNIIKTSNEVNLLFGVTGGTVKGTAHALGRILSGIADIATFPVPTKPISTPAFVWENWYTDTQYGPYFPTKHDSQIRAPRGMSYLYRRY